MKKFKHLRFGAFVLAILMCACTFNVAAFAAEGNQSPYVYQYVNWYARSIHKYTETGDSTPYLPATYLLKNGNEEFVAYCVDLSVSAKKTTMYKRLNLEDVTYFKDDATASKVRTIVNNGFWPDDTTKTLAALRTATGKSNLTAAEALSGTQLAIWAHGNSGSATISNYYSVSATTTAPGTYQTQSGVGNTANEHGDLKNSRSATTAANIAAVRDYLLNLGETQPTTKSVADIIFNDSHFVSWYKVNSSDGSVKNGYEVTIAFKLASTSTSGDLTLTASQNGNTVYSSRLDKVPFSNGQYTITFKTNDIKSDVSFSLNGNQNIPDSVYFYQAENVSASQSFVGKGSGTTHVDASAKISMKNITVDDHNYDNGVITKEPTCTEKGEKTFTCKNDPTHTYTEEIAPKGHTPVTDEKTEPTCTDTGLTEGSHCKDCGETLVKQEEIPSLDHEFDEGVVTKEPTCTEKGEKTFTCKNDPTHTYTEEIAPKGHTPVTDEKTEPTCTDTGLTEGSHCKDCGETLVKQEEIPSLDHEFDEGVVTKEPTCTEKGEKTFTCKNDPNHTYTEEISETEHKIVVDEAVAPTYTDTGLTEGSHCSECGTVFTEQTVIDKLTYEEFTVEDEKKTETKNDNSSTIVDSGSNTLVKEYSTSKSDNSTKSPDTGNNTVEIIMYSMLIAGLGSILAYTVSLKKKENN